jgi:hypothetical protein
MRESAYVRAPDRRFCQLQVLGAVLCQQGSKHQQGCRECLYIGTKMLVIYRSA